MIPVKLLATCSMLPGRVVTSEEVSRAAYPDRDPALLRTRTGIDTRHWADPGASHTELGAAVLRHAIARAGVDGRAIERVVHVCCTGGDTLLPATANAVAERAGLRGTCDAFDLGNACLGFLTAFDLAARGIATGLGLTAVVVTELFSRHLDPSEPRAYAVFGDAAAAAIFGPAGPGEGLLASYLRNDGALRGSVQLAHAGLTRAWEPVRFGASNQQIAAEATDALCHAADEALRRADLSIADIDWVLPHQPNGVMLGALGDRLRIPPGRTLPIVREVGSIGAASVPVSLDRLVAAGRLRPGQRILFPAVGAGISYGALIYQH
jgi:3-oxoacyl-(acyl-carrier-protein) synthase III